MIRVELGKLSEKIDNLKDVHKELKATDEIAKNAIARVAVSEHRLKKIEDGQTWLWRTIGGALIAGIIGLLFVFVKLGAGGQ
jgi:hypothetical protein